MDFKKKDSKKEIFVTSDHCGNNLMNALYRNSWKIERKDFTAVGRRMRVKQQFA